MTEKLKLRESYSNWVTHNNQLAPVDEAMARSIGGEFEAFGDIEREMLVFYGLQPEHYVIDVGCGAGRLSKPRADYLRGPYLGTDIARIGCICGTRGQEAGLAFCRFSGIRNSRERRQS